MLFLAVQQGRDLFDYCKGIVEFTEEDEIFLPPSSPSVAIKSRWLPGSVITRALKLSFFLNKIKINL